MSLNYSLDDTIAAISTPQGAGGIGIVRLSGPEALVITNKLFMPANKEWRFPETHRLYYGHIKAPETGQNVDEALVSYMIAPHSYTCQDVVEINLHGGPLVVRRVLTLALFEGARLAEPGEFTLRAFANGRIDLAQAEAVMDVISAGGERALTQAVHQLEGHLSSRVTQIRKLLLDVLVHLEAGMDFPQDEIPSVDVIDNLDAASEGLCELLTDADSGVLIRQGVRVALAGLPNVGKSSLLNRLLEFERAIVTEIPGTTRDTLEETLVIQGVTFVLVDTAGIAASDDPIERIGVARSRQAMTEADLVLLVVDGHTPPLDEEQLLADELAAVAGIVVCNKSDLTPCYDYVDFLPALPHISISALTGDGLVELRQAMLEVTVGAASEGGGALVTNPRHESLLYAALTSVSDALVAAKEALPDEMVAIDVREAVHYLGLITGENADEELLDTIFSTFCIGK